MKNILFLIADDWSREVAPFYGNPILHTPHIDALSAKGITFEQAFCASPTCAASRANILTGQYTHTHGQYGHPHGVHGFRTHDHMRSLPDILNQAGFATGLVGKAHFEPAARYPFQFNPSLDLLACREFAAATQRFLQHDAADKAFFLMVASGYPHRIGSGFGCESIRPGIEDRTYRPSDVRVPDFLPDLPEVREDLANYYQAVSRWDQVVGATLAALNESGRAQDTMVVVTTDHGMPFVGAKASSFEEGHRCPLIINTPDMQANGKRNQALVNWVDLLPTMLEWCGVGYPEDAPRLPGRSFLPILEDDAPRPGDGTWESTFFSHCFHEVTNYYPYRVLRTRRYKYVLNLAHELSCPLPSDLFRSLSWQGILRHQPGHLGLRNPKRFFHQDREALYDLEDDPCETENLVDAPEHAERLEGFRERLNAWRIETKDPWLETSFQHNEFAQDPSFLLK